MAPGSFESVEMEFWSDWDEDVDIPSPLRIVKRPSTSANTADTGTHIPLRVAKRPTTVTKSDAAIPNPLRIIKRPNNITTSDAGTNSREVINIPRRSSSIYNCISSSPPDSDGGCLKIHKLRKPRPVVQQGRFYDYSPTEKGDVAGEILGGIKLTKEVKDPKLNQRAEGCIRFL